MDRDCSSAPPPPLLLLRPPLPVTALALLREGQEKDLVKEGGGGSTDRRDELPTACPPSLVLLLLLLLAPIPSLLRSPGPGLEPERPVGFVGEVRGLSSKVMQVAFCLTQERVFWEEPLLLLLFDVFPTALPPLLLLMFVLLLFRLLLLLLLSLVKLLPLIQPLPLLPRGAALAIPLTSPLFATLGEDADELLTRLDRRRRKFF